MRIAVSGKGGSGKTSLSATLARLLARRGYTVNALDDDPNPNLATALGLTPEQRNTLQRVPRENILAEHQEDGKKVMRLSLPFAEILTQYGAIGPDGVRVLSMIGVLGAGKG